MFLACFCKKKKKWWQTHTHTTITYRRGKVSNHKNSWLVLLLLYTQSRKSCAGSCTDNHTRSNHACCRRDHYSVCGDWCMCVPKCSFWKARGGREKSVEEGEGGKNCESSMAGKRCTKKVFMSNKDCKKTLRYCNNEVSANKYTHASPINIQKDWDFAGCIALR